MPVPALFTTMTRMEEAKTLAQVRQDLFESDENFCFCTLPLYILAERHPQPDDPYTYRIAGERYGEKGILVFLSPLDAALEKDARNQGGNRYEVMPFEILEPRQCIVHFDGFLSLLMVFGYLASDHGLIPDKSGRQIPLTYDIYEPMDVEEMDGEKVTLGIAPRVTEWFDSFYKKAGIPDYPRIIYDTVNALRIEIETMIGDALERANFVSNDAKFTHCAVYDPLERVWRYVPKEEVGALCATNHPIN